MATPKQAVVLIHGIGEQIPMDTLRGFVKAVWVTDGSVRENEFVSATAWSKPDTISGDYELRRLTTAYNREGKRTDFFEFYWAHLMQGTTLSHIGAWAKILVFRAPWRVPQQLRGVWFFLVAVLMVGVLAALNHYFKWVLIPGWVSVVGWIAWILLVKKLLVNVVGDAARYLHVAPANIEIRRQIREAGIKLLQKLQDSPDYDRIIIVGHSLGTVIGYDILTHLWLRYHDAHAVKGADFKTYTALDELEKLSRDAQHASFDLEKYQTAQTKYLQELHSQGNKWRVTDFVTLGSPLAHASVLMARNGKEFDDKKSEREFPICPPFLEKNDGIVGFSFEKSVEGKALRVPHYAAVFAPTRWTNLYFPCSYTVKGDLIGGPMRPAFGFGIRDIPVETNIFCGLFSHTFYWDFPGPQTKQAPTCIMSLRKALRICQTPSNSPIGKTSPS